MRYLQYDSGAKLSILCEFTNNIGHSPKKVLVFVRYKQQWPVYIK